MHGFPEGNRFLCRDSLRTINLSAGIPCGEQISMHEFPEGNKFSCWDSLWEMNLSAGIPSGEQISLLSLRGTF